MRTTMKKAAVASIAALMAVTPMASKPEQAVAADNQVKNVIMLIPDGMSMSATTIARYLLEGNETGSRNLTMDEYNTALVTTTWANGPITDSAPAGTAYSTGHKGQNGAVGLDATRTPKATVLEAAQLQGKAVGLVATSEFMHATPADYSAHDPVRGNYAAIAEQMLNQDIDVLLGTGAAKVPGATLDILATAEAKGYTILDDRAEMLATDATKLWGNFSNFMNEKGNLSYDLDRDPEKEPSLAEMTQKAIDTLKNDEDGFFLMVEGSKIDWAAHANDSIGILYDALAFDRAFKAAVDFAKQDGNTVVIAATDHGNSGISLGHYDLTGYDSAPFSILAPLRGATKTAEGAMALFNAEKSNVDEVLRAYGIQPNGYQPADAASSDRTTKNNAKVNALIETFKTTKASGDLIKIMNQLAYIGYSTGGHSGEDVPLYVYAPAGVSVPEGMIDNTDVAKYAATSMGLSLDDASSKLFVDVTSRPGAKVENNTLTLTENGKTLVVKANQSVATLDGVAKSLQGQVAVQINGKFYVPQTALNLIDSTTDTSKYTLSGTAFTSTSLGYKTTVTAAQGAEAEEVANPNLLVVGTLKSGGQVSWTVSIHKGATATTDIAVNNKFSSIAVYLMDGTINWNDTNFAGVKSNILTLTVPSAN
ncbi:alkaline phosphatase [Paenibacillus phyllosphaerae]|uniref:Alkaline phosphatase n=1 Tax=Paenibacillus phyllosphaerae TaxID=274593 RepID=A0A7W5FPV9_9BACL|nr:alkaline phosphatase [Paenibacillus phyllosphaerae]MBB3112424.1 alkaline phosphatase [Paenibacillus phyllosphaerae]